MKGFKCADHDLTESSHRLCRTTLRICRASPELLALTRTGLDSAQHHPAAAFRAFTSRLWIIALLEMLYMGTLGRPSRCQSPRQQRLMHGLDLRLAEDGGLERLYEGNEVSTARHVGWHLTFEPGAADEDDHRMQMLGSHAKRRLQRLEMLVVLA